MPMERAAHHLRVDGDVHDRNLVEVQSSILVEDSNTGAHVLPLR